jgi:septum formation protein
MFTHYKIILGSNSPRRKELLKWAGFEFEVMPIAYDEVLPNHKLNEEDITTYFAEQKALSVRDKIKHDELLLTADTLVFLDGKMMGKPVNRDAAFEMLQLLSGKTHTVITGVCMLTEKKKIIFSDTTKVTFRAFELAELEYYLDNYQVMDKAGAYGAQDWLGLIGIERLEGSYFNVMGLPIHKVYDHLKYFAEHQ